MPHAACCMLHAPAYCSCCCRCCCSLSVAEQPWGSLGRLSRHRVIAHCTNLLCNKFPVLTASPPTPPPPLPLPPPATAPACVPAQAVAVFRFRFDFLALNAQRMRRLSNCNWQLATGNLQPATGNVQHLWHSQVELRPLLRPLLRLLLLLVLSLCFCFNHIACNSRRSPKWVRGVARGEIQVVELVLYVRFKWVSTLQISNGI